MTIAAHPSPQQLLPPLVIGVTGGIGCGKSTVSHLFSRLGIPALDADDLTRELSAPTGRAYPDIVALMGPQSVLPSGHLDRTLIRQRVFADEGLRRRLEAIIHPLVAGEAARRIAGWQSPYGLWIVPLLLEKPGPRTPAVDRILVIDCSEDQQVQRITRSRELSEKDARAIISAQCPRRQRLSLADDIIDNSSTPEKLPEQVARLDHLYRELAGKRHSLPLKPEKNP